MQRLVAILFAALALLAAGCGGEDDAEALLTEDSLRACLAGAGFGPKPSDQAEAIPDFSPSLAAVAPDFAVFADDGTAVDVIVQGTEEKAERTAADVNGVVQSLGGPAEVIRGNNVVLILSPPPSDVTRRAAESCFK